MRQVLMCWIGKTDLRAPSQSEVIGIGPIAQALAARSFIAAYLLTDSADAEVKPFLKWLKSRSAVPLHVLKEPLNGPTNFGEIYEAATRACAKAREDQGLDAKLTFHLSPGTPAMAAVWILIGKTRHPAELIESSKEHGVRTAQVPFDISADFIPDLLREQDERLRAGSAAGAPEAPEFADIIHRSRVMERLIQRARRVAIRNVPVLIEGESGTGKEMLARAIHRASLRRDRAFVPVNCGALPPTLVESALFGHERGAFTDAKEARKGYFEAANGGTIFLDEVGELPLPAQITLLRVIQEGEVVRVGATKAVPLDVRIIAATNRTLTEEIAAGRFREDLFYRLAVAVLNIPPLRDRAGDIALLLDRLLAQVNREATTEPGYQEKSLSAGAKNVLVGHAWPGNVRELLNTLRRAAIWSEGRAISAEEVREALLPVSGGGPDDLLRKPLGNGFNLRRLLDDIARIYLQRAMDEANGNKTKAAELVGLRSYQTLTNWLAKREAQE
jgi:transcriptional regulator with PAS, ATPase and Fis domain